MDEEGALQKRGVKRKEDEETSEVATAATAALTAGGGERAIGEPRRKQQRSSSTDGTPARRTRSGSPSEHAQAGGQQKRKRRLSRRRSGVGVGDFLAPPDTHPETGKKQYRYGSHPRPEKGRTDTRYSVLHDEWFRGKTCLEIGCNNGDLAMTIAQYLQPASYTGIDIDSRLISSARRMLRKRQSLRGGEFPDSFAQVYGHTVAPLPASSTTSTSTAAAAPSEEDCHSGSDSDGEEEEESGEEPAGSGQDRMLQNVRFLCGNFIAQEFAPEPASFDTIVCLNVTKWIHLNWGDDGIRALFEKIKLLLKPGGLLILEAQPISSYRHTRPQTPESTYTLRTMTVPPSAFKSLLVKQLRFSLIHKASVLEDSKKNHYRDVMVLRKNAQG